MRNLVLATLLLAGLLSPPRATWKPPEIPYDDTPRRAVLAADPPKPVQVVEIPKLLPLPGQLKPVPDGKTPRPNPPIHARASIRPTMPRACSPPAPANINAVQVYPFSDGALYQVYAAPGEMTDIALEAGEQLVGTVRLPPAIRCAGSSATPRAGRGRQTNPYPAQADTA